MLFQRINRSNPEKVFIVVYNSYATASLTNGQVVQWDSAGDADGISVTKPEARAAVAGSGIGIAGIVADTIAVGAYGLVQVYGYHSAVRVHQDTASAATNIQAGTPLFQSVSAEFALEPTLLTITAGAAVTISYPCAFALAAQASWTTKAIAAFIKAL